MGGLVSNARPSLAGQCLPGAGLDNCELNCTEFCFIVSILVNEYFTKEGESFSGEDKAIVCIVYLVR